jgi:cyclophilin family peptidyl-prolyl cis-trans isomerase
MPIAESSTALPRKHAESQRGRPARLDPALDLAGVQPHAGAPIARRATRCELRLARQLEFFRRAEARIRLPLRRQAQQRRLVDRRTLALPVWPVRAADVRAFVPVEPQPAQLAQLEFEQRLVTAFGVGVLDAQNEATARGARRQPAEQGRAGIAQVQCAARTGRKTGDVSGYRHERASYRIRPFRSRGALARGRGDAYHPRCPYHGCAMPLNFTVSCRALRVLLLLATGLATPAMAQSTVPVAATGPVQVRMTTSLGAFTVEVDPVRAPLSAANFLQYVRDGHYDGTIFHRVIGSFVVQGGGHLPDGSEKPTRPGVPNESGNGLSNRRGTIAMARVAAPHSGTAQFYVNVNDNLALDPSPSRWGYAVFGRVVAGMDVVDKIASTATGARGPFAEDTPLEMVLIETATVVGDAAPAQ